MTRISQQATSCQFQMADNFSCPSMTSKSPLLNNFSVFVGDSGICSKQPHRDRQGEGPLITSFSTSSKCDGNNTEAGDKPRLYSLLFHIYFSFPLFQLQTFQTNKNKSERSAPPCRKVTEGLNPHLSKKQFLFSSYSMTQRKRMN